MKDPLQSKKKQPTFEINWNIRENFSEAALTSFFEEIENNYLAIEKNIV